MKKKFFYAMMFVFFVFGRQFYFFAETPSSKNVVQKNFVKKSFVQNFLQPKALDFKKDSSAIFYGDDKKTFATSFVMPFSQFKFSVRENNYNFGISAFSDKFLPKLPFSLKVGNISDSGSLSKLKSAFISGGNSPFSADFCEVNCISSELPGFTSFSKPVSAFFQCGFKDSKSFLKEAKVNCFYTPEKENLAFSALVKSSFWKNKLKVAFSVTSGFFSYDENFFSSWFSKDLYFSCGNHFCALYQISAGIPFFETVFTLGSFENPFGTVSNFYRLDGTFFSKKANLSFSLFYNPNSKEKSVFTASENVLQDCFQFRVNFVHKVPVKNGFLRNGILAFSKMGLSENFADCKLSLGSQLTFPLFSVSFYCAGNAKITRNGSGLFLSSDEDFSVTFMNGTHSQNQDFSFEFENLVLNFSNRWYFDVLSPMLLVKSTISFFDGCKIEGTNSKVSLKLYFQKNPKFTGEGSFSFSSKNGEILSKKINFSLYSSFCVKKISFLCSLGWKTELQN